MQRKISPQQRLDEIGFDDVDLLEQRDLLDPVTREVMFDPVITVDDDGNYAGTYSRKTAEKLIENKARGANGIIVQKIQREADDKQQLIEVFVEKQEGEVGFFSRIIKAIKDFFVGLLCGFQPPANDEPPRAVEMPRVAPKMRTPVKPVSKPTSPSSVTPLTVKSSEASIRSMIEALAKKKESSGDIPVSENNFRHMQIFSAIAHWRPIWQKICDAENEGDNRYFNDTLLLRSLVGHGTIFESQLIEMLEKYHLNGLINIYIRRSPEDKKEIKEIYADAARKFTKIFHKVPKADLKRIRNVLHHEIDTESGEVILRQLINEGVVKVGVEAEQSVYDLLNKCKLLHLMDESVFAKPEPIMPWLTNGNFVDYTLEYPPLFQICSAITLSPTILARICDVKFNGERKTAHSLADAWEGMNWEKTKASMLIQLLQDCDLHGLVEIYFHPKLALSESMVEICEAAEAKFAAIFSKLSEADLREIEKRVLINPADTTHWILILRQLILEGVVKVGQEAEQSIRDLLSKCDLLDLMEPIPEVKIIKKNEWALRDEGASYRWSDENRDDPQLNLVCDAIYFLPNALKNIHDVELRGLESKSKSELKNELCSKGIIACERDLIRLLKKHELHGLVNLYFQQRTNQALRDICEKLEQNFSPIFDRARHTDLQLIENIALRNPVRSTN